MTSVAAYFDEIAPEWDARGLPDYAALARVVRLAGVGEGARVLDLGCGTGVMEPAYLDAGAREIVAVDASARMITEAYRKFAEEDRVRFVCGDFLAAELACFGEEGSFDSVVIFNAYPHFLDRPMLIERVARMLVPGGRFLVAHSMGYDALNEHHKQVPEEISLALQPVDIEAEVWRERFAIDAMEDEADFYAFGGTLKS